MRVAQPARELQLIRDRENIVGEQCPVVAGLVPLIVETDIGEAERRQADNRSERTESGPRRVGVERPQGGQLADQSGALSNQRGKLSLLLRSRARNRL